MESDEIWVENRHREAIEQGEPGYIDKHSSLYVLTGQTLLEQGECCGKGCRHCPWPPEEQQRAGRPGSSTLAST